MLRPVKISLAFMLLGAGLSLWMFFGEMLSFRLTTPHELSANGEEMRASTRVDLYLVELGGSPVPVLGDAASISDELPPSVDRSLVGSSLPGMKILAVIPAGTTVVATSAIRTVNAPVELRGSVEGHQGEVDLSFVQDYAAGLPSLTPRLFRPAPAPSPRE